jgi:hypothetical protein
MQGRYFVWGVRVPADDTKEPDRYMRAPLDAIARAEGSWTRITWNEDTRQHDVVTSVSEKEPEWPDLSRRDLIALAFKDRVIQDRNHPVLRQLRGES